MIRRCEQKSMPSSCGAARRFGGFSTTTLFRGSSSPMRERRFVMRRRGPTDHRWAGRAGDNNRALRTATAVCAGLIVLSGCAREERRLREAPASVRSKAIVQSDLHPGVSAPPAPAKNPYEGNAHAIAEGRRLYVWFNCIGCHFNGGGGIGPPLMDEKWIYGSEPANIFAAIVEGRPDGMPSFRGRLTDQQVWQLAAYVKTLSGDAPKSAKPGRDEGMQDRKAPAQTEPPPPKDERNSTPQKSGD
ncbi:MAG: cytochrome C [Opitutus sp.]|nr:cytochrome C [Opitutus sp.]